MSRTNTMVDDSRLGEEKLSKKELRQEAANEARAGIDNRLEELRLDGKKPDNIRQIEEYSRDPSSLNSKKFVNMASDIKDEELRTRIVELRSATVKSSDFRKEEERLNSELIRKQNEYIPPPEPDYDKLPDSRNESLTPPPLPDERELESAAKDAIENAFPGLTDEEMGKITKELSDRSTDNLPPDTNNPINDALNEVKESTPDISLSDIVQNESKKESITVEINNDALNESLKSIEIEKDKKPENSPESVSLEKEPVSKENTDTRTGEQKNDVRDDVKAPEKEKTPERILEPEKEKENHKSLSADEKIKSSIILLKDEDKYDKNLALKEIAAQRMDGVREGKASDILKETLCRTSPDIERMSADDIRNDLKQKNFSQLSNDEKIEYLSKAISATLTGEIRSVDILEKEVPKYADKLKEIEDLKSPINQREADERSLKHELLDDLKNSIKKNGSDLSAVLNGMDDSRGESLKSDARTQGLIKTIDEERANRIEQAELKARVIEMSRNPSIKERNAVSNEYLNASLTPELTRDIRNLLSKEDSRDTALTSKEKDTLDAAKGICSRISDIRGEEYKLEDLYRRVEIDKGLVKARDAEARARQERDDRINRNESLYDSLREKNAEKLRTSVERYKECREKLDKLTETKNPILKALRSNKVEKYNETLSVLKDEVLNNTKNSLSLISNYERALPIDKQSDFVTERTERTNEILASIPQGFRDAAFRSIEKEAPSIHTISDDERAKSFYKQSTELLDKYEKKNDLSQRSAEILNRSEWLPRDVEKSLSRNEGVMRDMHDARKDAIKNLEKDFIPQRLAIYKELYQRGESFEIDRADYERYKSRMDAINSRDERILEKNESLNQSIKEARESLNKGLSEVQNLLDKYDEAEMRSIYYRGKSGAVDITRDEENRLNAYKELSQIEQRYIEHLGNAFFDSRFEGRIPNQNRFEKAMEIDKIVDDLKNIDGRELPKEQTPEIDGKNPEKDAAPQTEERESEKQETLTKFSVDEIRNQSFVRDISVSSDIPIEKAERIVNIALDRLDNRDKYQEAREIAIKVMTAPELINDREADLLIRQKQIERYLDKSLQVLKNAGELRAEDAEKMASVPRIFARGEHSRDTYAMDITREADARNRVAELRDTVKNGFSKLYDSVRNFNFKPVETNSLNDERNSDKIEKPSLYSRFSDFARSRITQSSLRNEDTKPTEERKSHLTNTLKNVLNNTRSQSFDEALSSARRYVAAGMRNLADKIYKDENN